MTTAEHQRNWTTVADDAVARVGGRAAVEAAIDALDWQDVPEGGALTVGFMPGMGINECIRELRLPKVSRVAIGSFDCPAPDAEGDGFYPGFYGIACRYKNGPARVYVLDVGASLLPVCSDFWPEQDAEPSDAPVRPRLGDVPVEDVDGALEARAARPPRPTYRERREARVERLEGWAEGRARDADAAHAKVHAIADQIPFGQPILVGHHSEGRARADQRRMEDGMRASVENSRLASRHSERAANIERQLVTSIYDDDPDAVERLEGKLAALEQERERRKAANAAYRKEHRAELKAMSAYERSQAVPYASYSIQNLGGNISTTRKRLENLRAAKAVVAAGGRGRGRQMESRYGGDCADCGAPFEKGAPIVWYRLTREAVHASCPEGAA